MSIDVRFKQKIMRFANLAIILIVLVYLEVESFAGVTYWTTTTINPQPIGSFTTPRCGFFCVYPFQSIKCPTNCPNLAYAPNQKFCPNGYSSYYCYSNQSTNYTYKTTTTSTTTSTTTTIPQHPIDLHA
ncbi:MAG: hypothetical protein ACP5RP_00760, partial [Candidatus Micrarchaeia archaeon]